MKGDKMQVKVEKLECLRCNYKWVPRNEDVRQCPKCRTTHWETARKVKKEA